jgi:hypothetical protein
MLFSLGVDCQVAHQLRRATGGETAFLFDWLISRNDPYAALRSDAEAWFQPGNWEIVGDGIRLLDKGTGLEFQHEFPRIGPDTQIIDVARVEGHLRAARDKYLYLRGKTLAALAEAAEPVLIRREYRADTAEAKQVADATLAAFSAVNPAVKVVVLSEDAEQESLSPRHLALKTWPGDDWTGDDGAWDRVFECIDAWREGRLKVTA